MGVKPYDALTFCTCHFYLKLEVLTGFIYNQNLRVSIQYKQVIETNKTTIQSDVDNYSASVTSKLRVKRAMPLK